MEKEKEAKQRSDKRKLLQRAAADKNIRKYGLLFLAGLLILLYPPLGSLFQRLGSRMAINSYEKKIAGAESADLASMLYEAQEYNRLVADAGKFGSFAAQAAAVSEREETTALEENGTMAWLEIPAIGVSVPIHSGGIGSGITQMEGSSLPVGEINSRCVLADKGGWPGIRQLKKLDQLAEGDYLYLHVLGKTLAYRVTEMKEVEKADSDSAAIEPDSDMLTLIGTSGASGSGRLMVDGERTDYSYSIYSEQTRKSEL